ncbi:GFA family protein [Janthinobacterium violaceinigrum]|uniref:GFA family protein n=1 Tax=Janthinobacterium violaceinigrum TaxID=2654252 RepID=A0A6I1IHJ9_9BURK|nr:GFA family protein [Janthinobacterium violaceinigrum]KAB8066858.1 GFA family protein [Janthinobacterium violaceinigrum]
MKRTCHGSCHCGAVRFAAEIDLAAPSLRCNCSYCLKIRCWASQVPATAFRLLAGEAALSEYRFGAGRERHYFCRHCGVRLFSRGDSARSGAFVGIGVNCLDDMSAAALARVPVTFVDGLHDEWNTPPQETRHL